MQRRIKKGRKCSTTMPCLPLGGFSIFESCCSPPTPKALHSLLKGCCTEEGLRVSWGRLTGELNRIQPCQTFVSSLTLSNCIFLFCFIRHADGSHRSYGEHFGGNPHSHLHVEVSLIMYLQDANVDRSAAPEVLHPLVLHCIMSALQTEHTWGTETSQHVVFCL